jgi:hypothetical protein
LIGRYCLCARGRQGLNYARPGLENTITIDATPLQHEQIADMFDVISGNREITGLPFRPSACAKSAFRKHTVPAASYAD